MKIKYVTGDLIAAPEAFLVHGCNAQHKMNSGVAKLIRENFPIAYTTYMDTPNLKVGMVVSALDEAKDKVIFNAITQEFYGRDTSVVYVSYDGLRECIVYINSLFDDDKYRGESVAFPLIGAGLANGKWSIISSIIEEESTNFQPVVYLIDGVVPEE